MKRWTAGPCKLLFCLVSGIIFLCHPTNGLAQNRTETPATNENCIIVELYLAEGQQTSEMALAGATRLAESRSGIRLIPRSLDSEKGRERLKRIAQYFKFDETATPVIYCCNRVIRFGQNVDDYENQLKSALQIEVFTRVGCSRCALAKTWLPTITQRYPGIELVYREITNDAVARQDLNNLVRKYSKAATSTPVFHFCDQMIVGFDRPETTGVRIEKVLSRWSTTCPRSNGNASDADLSGFSPSSAREVATRVPFHPPWHHGFGQRQ